LNGGIPARNLPDQYSAVEYLSGIFQDDIDPWNMCLVNSWKVLDGGIVTWNFPDTNWTVEF
jgi:hypothetical protein